MAEVFLVRTKQNQIWGPITKEILAERVLKGELESQDEICLSGEYWVFLHEKEEVKRLLGVVPPDKKRSRHQEDEITETETETVVPELTKTPILDLKKSAPVPTRYDEDTNYHLEQLSLYKVLVFLLLVTFGIIVYRIFLRISLP